MKSIIIGVVVVIVIAYLLLYAFEFLLKNFKAIIGLLVIGAIIYYLPWWVWVIIFIIGAIAGNNGKDIEEKSPPPPPPPHSHSHSHSRPPPPPPPKENNIENRTPEEILGLKYPWTSEELKAAYKREAGRTHPDKWIGKPEIIQKAMEAEFKMIQEAYRHLGG